MLYTFFYKDDTILFKINIRNMRKLRLMRTCFQGQRHISTGMPKRANLSIHIPECLRSKRSQMSLNAWPWHQRTTSEEVISGLSHSICTRQMVCARNLMGSRLPKWFPSSGPIKILLTNQPTNQLTLLGSCERIRREKWWTL